MLSSPKSSSPAPSLAHDSEDDNNNNVINLTDDFEPLPTPRKKRQTFDSPEVNTSSGHNERTKQALTNIEEDQPSRTKFRAEISSSQMIALGLRGISNGKRDQRVQVDILPAEGIRFTSTDGSKTLQGCATISEGLFETFDFDDESVDLCFRVSLSLLLDCITMCSGQTRLRMGFNEMNETLAIQLNEGDMVTECTLKTLGDSEDDSLDFARAFQGDEAVIKINKAIISSDRLRDAFLELADMSGASHVKITMSPKYPFFRMSAIGQNGSCDVDFAQGPEFSSFIQFECDIELVFSYRLSLLLLAAKPLSEAEKSFLRINSEGMLSIQHLIKIDGQKTYVDFFLLAVESTDDM